MKTVLLVNGFNGIPEMFTYLKRELEAKNYKVIMPEFPVREEISVEKYFEKFDEYKDIFNDEVIVIAHSIGNPMFVKYLSDRKINVFLYISLAGFSHEFYVPDKDVLNEKTKLINLSNDELEDAKTLIQNRYSIYSDNDHIVPLELLEGYVKDVDSIAYFVPGIGHMGKKINLKEMPWALEIINKFE